MKYGEGVTRCKKHQSTVYPDAGPKYLRQYHEEHKDCDGPSLQSQLDEAREDRSHLGKMLTEANAKIAKQQALMQRVVDAVDEYWMVLPAENAIDDMAEWLKK